MNYIKKVFNKRTIGNSVISILFTIAYLYGDIVVYNKEINFLQVIKYIFIFMCYSLLVFYLEKLSLCKTIHTIFDKIHFDFSNYHHILLVFLICFLPHLLLKYPMGFWFDEYMQLKQGLGLMNLTTHFPLLYTYILTFFYKFGESLGDHNIGIFVLSFIKYIITANILAYTIYSLNKYDVKKSLLIIFTIFFAFSPFIAGNIGTSTKDVYYSSYVILFCLQLYKYVKDRNAFWGNKKEFIIFIISALLVSLTRKNGLYIIIPTIIVMVIKELKINNKKVSFLLVLSIIICIGTYKIIDLNPNASKGSIKEALSIPFQQTARFVKYHSDLVTNEEKEIINRILPYDDLSTLYNEKISDPVKDHCRKDFSNQELLKYFEVWLKQFLKSPSTYIEATTRQNIYLVYPGKNIYKYTIECNAGVLDGYDQSKGLLQTPLWLKENIQPKYWSFLNLFHEIPIIELLNNMAVFIIVFIICLYLMIKRKEYNKLLVLIPLIISILVIVAGPTIRTHPRYAYPIIWTFPIWISLLFEKDINKKIVK